MGIARDYIWRAVEAATMENLIKSVFRMENIHLFNHKVVFFNKLHKPLIMGLLQHTSPHLVRSMLNIQKIKT